jgi:histone acetyltransferase (RNA polymerase elongator complex component)
MDKEYRTCPESVSGHGLANVRGECPYCKKKFESASPKPKYKEKPELIEAYEYFYDPNYGSARVRTDRPFDI